MEKADKRNIKGKDMKINKNALIFIIGTFLIVMVVCIFLLKFRLDKGNPFTYRTTGYYQCYDNTYYYDSKDSRWYKYDESTGLWGYVEESMVVNSVLTPTGGIWDYKVEEDRCSAPPFT